MFARIDVRLNARSESGWIPRINAHLADTHRNFRVGGSVLKDFVRLLQVVHSEFGGSVYDELGSVRGLQSESAFICRLTFGQRRRRVWIFPAIMVPIVHVLTEHNQRRTSNRLK